MNAASTACADDKADADSGAGGDEAAEEAAAAAAAGEGEDT
jgi:hypothetical protein